MSPSVSRRRYCWSASILALGLMLFSAHGTRAQTVVWAGGTGNWDQGPVLNFVNWGLGSILSGLLPDLGDNVHINSGTVTLNVDSTIKSLMMSASGSLIISDGRILTINSVGGSTLANATIAFASTGGATKLRLSGGDLTLVGSGTLTLGNNTSNIIYGFGGTERLINQTNLIQGAGQIGGGQMALTNQATIIANQSAGLVIRPNSAGVTNTGTLRAASGATLTLQGDIGSFTNTGGTIEAQADSTVQISNASVSGGSLITTGAGTVILGNATLSGVSINNSSTGVVRVASIATVSGNYIGAAGSQFRIPNGAALILSGGGSFTLNGGMFLDASAGTANLVVADGAPLVLGGTGSITLSNSFNNYFVGVESGAVTIGSGLTFQGSGVFSGATLGITNNGLILANNAAHQLHLTPSFLGLTNNGVIRATAGATLLLNGNYGNITNGASASIVADNSSHIDLYSARITGGTLSSSGTGHFHVFDGESNTSFSTLTIASGTKIEVADASLRLNGTITNAGTISLLGDEYGRLYVGEGGATLTGGGTIAMSADHNRISTFEGGVLNNMNNVFQGAGHMGDGEGAFNFNNQGTVNANLTSADFIIIPSSGTVTNTGTLRASSGGTLKLSTGMFQNTGGMIEAEIGSTVKLENVTIDGGTLKSTGGSLLVNFGATLQNVTLFSGSSLSLYEASTTLIGSFVNNGTLALNTTEGYTELFIGSAALTLSGTGAITLNNSTNNKIYGTAAGNVLTLALGQTLSGAGQIGLNSLGLVNQGIIHANRSTSLVIDVTGSTFTNHGTLKATGAGGLVLNDTMVINTGSGLVEAATGSTLTAAGSFMQSGAGSTTRLSGGTIAATSFGFGTLTSLDGSGTISGPVSSEAAIRPGGSGTVGTLVFDSTLSLGPLSILHFNIGGTTPGTGYDRINGTNVVLNGFLNLSFVGDFRFSILPTDTFTLINTSSALSGTFFGVPNGTLLATTDGFGFFQVNYLGNSLVLSNFSAIPEPSTYALIGFGAVAVLVMTRRRRAL